MQRGDLDERSHCFKLGTRLARLTAPEEALLLIADRPVAEDHLPKRLGRITLDVEAQHWFSDVLPGLPPESIEKILEDMLASEGADLVTLDSRVREAWSE